LARSDNMDQNIKAFVRVVRLALLDCHTMFHEIFLILYDINDLYDLIGF
jgi:hypothetical protein